MLACLWEGAMKIFSNNQTILSSPVTVYCVLFLDREGQVDEGTTGS